MKTNVSTPCTVTIFEMVWNCREMLVGANSSPPLAFVFYWIFWVLYCFGFIEKVLGPGLQGLHVATLVQGYHL